MGGKMEKTGSDACELAFRELYAEASLPVVGQLAVKQAMQADADLLKLASELYPEDMFRGYVELGGRFEKEAEGRVSGLLSKMSGGFPKGRKTRV